MDLDNTCVYQVKIFQDIEEDLERSNHGKNILTSWRGVQYIKKARARIRVAVDAEICLRS